MDRGTWQATVYGVTGVGHDQVTKHSTSGITANAIHKIGKAVVGA